MKSDKENRKKIWNLNQPKPINNYLNRSVDSFKPPLE